MVRLDSPNLKQVIRRDHPEQSAKEAHLKYVSDQSPGISREHHGGGFLYRDGNGKKISDAQTLFRIKALAIPPAWHDVWICPDENGHIQASGRDDRNRKQYRYHPRWREVRDENKYDRMRAFGKLLPHIRRRTSIDLAKPGLPREKVLAAMVRIMMQTFMRVGNEEYAKSNNHYGLSTLKDRHARINGSHVQFHFTGKSGIDHDVDLNDRKLAKIVKQCRDLPGQQLFEYIDEDENVRSVSSDDVNCYLHEITGHDVTTKDFRTWAGTLLAARALCSVKDLPTSQTAAKRHIVAAIKEVARELGNTAAVCKKCYVHPKVLESFIDGSLRKHFSSASQEQGLLSLLRSKSSA